MTENRFRFVLLFWMFVALLLIASWCHAETIQWQNATQYTDGTAIAAADQGNITTRIYHGATSATATTLLATVQSGGHSWTGTIPYTKGQTGYFTASNAIGSGDEGAKAPPVAYTVPLVAPKDPTSITITK